MVIIVSFCLVVVAFVVLCNTNRPVEQVSTEEVVDAMRTVAQHLGITDEDLHEQGIPWSDFAQLLTTKGEVKFSRHFPSRCFLLKYF